MVTVVVWMALSPGVETTDPAIVPARQLLSALVEQAKTNRARPVPLTKDNYTLELFATTARAAEKVPVTHRGKALSLALGVGLDTSALMRSNPIVGSTWRRLESDDERRRRLAVLGKPTLHGRHDLVQHMAVSMALTVLLGEKRAESAAILKELLDANEGGSGFSFADLAADLAGIQLAKQLLADKNPSTRLISLRESKDLMLSPRGLPEGLSLTRFKEDYGGIRDARFLRVREDLIRRTSELRGLR